MGVPTSASKCASSDARGAPCTDSVRDGFVVAKAGARRRRSESSRSDSPYGRLAAESIGLALIAFSALAALALATYSPSDPLFRLTAVANAAGAVGATLAGLLFRTAGFGGVVLVGDGRGRRRPSAARPRSARRALLDGRRAAAARGRDASAARRAPRAHRRSAPAGNGLLGEWLASGERLLLSLWGAVLLNVLLAVAGGLAVTGVQNAHGAACRGARARAARARRRGRRCRDRRARRARAGIEAFHALEAIGNFAITSVLRARDGLVAGGSRRRRMARASRASRAPALTRAGSRSRSRLPRWRRSSTPIAEAGARRAAEATGSRRSASLAQARRAAHRRPPRRPQEAQPRAGSVPVLGAHAAGSVPASRHRDLPAPARRRSQLRPRQPDHELADPREEARGLRRARSRRDGASRARSSRCSSSSPAPGVKVNRITNLADDLALALRALSVRIIAPLPGKSVVGIEIPNPERDVVYIRDLLESENFRKSKSKLTLALGKDIFGNPVEADLAKMPHLLVAGATGTGKSVFLNALLCSILCRASPDELKLLLIDPKILELSIYEGIPHLIADVVTNPKRGVGGAARHRAQDGGALPRDGGARRAQHPAVQRARRRAARRRPDDAAPEAAAGRRAGHRGSDRADPVHRRRDRRAGGPDGRVGARRRGSAAAARADGARRGHPPGARDAAAERRRAHRRDQGELPVAHLVPGVVEDRLAHDHGSERRGASARPGRHALPAARHLEAAAHARRLRLREGGRGAGRVPAHAGRAALRRDADARQASRARRRKSAATTPTISTTARSRSSPRRATPRSPTSSAASRSATTAPRG